MMKTCFNYFVSYFYKIGNMNGIGNAKILRDEELNDYEGIKDIEEVIQKENNFDIVIILNWKGLK